ncbi:MAG: inositol monophosphatase family protein [Thermodesulfobacteriota bacterium]
MTDEYGIEELAGFADEAIRLCGNKALTFYGQGANRVKFDKGLVIDAGLQLADLFMDQLLSRFPDHRVFKNEEEGRGYSHDGARYLWVYDPLDGVANFQAGIPIWGMSLALLENYWPVLGLVFMPATGDIFHARADHEAFRGDRKIRVSGQDAISDESVLLTYSRFHQRYETGFPGKIRCLGCTAAHACYVAAGLAEAALINNLSYADLGAVRVIIEAAGGKIFRMDGSEFFLNEYLDGPMIAEDLLISTPEAGPQIQGHLRVLD